LSFRNDHDAAISRIAALEQELADARQAAQEESQRDDVRIGMLEREIADLTRHTPTAPRRARSPSTPGAAKPRPGAPIDELSQRGPAISRGWVVILGLFALVVLWAAIFIATGQTEIMRSI
jgi:hypothetical protein